MMLAEDCAKKIAEAIMQDASYKLGDILNETPAGAHVFVLVVMQGLVNSLKPMMTESDQTLFDYLLDHTNTIVAPAAMDPRRQEDDG